LAGSGNELPQVWNSSHSGQVCYHEVLSNGGQTMTIQDVHEAVARKFPDAQYISVKDEMSRVYNRPYPVRIARMFVYGRTDDNKTWNKRYSADSLEALMEELAKD
jgi:hypothetical protein